MVSSFEDHNSWLIGSWIVFGIRTDKKKIPGKRFAAALKQVGADPDAVEAFSTTHAGFAPLDVQTFLQGMMSEVQRKLAIYSKFQEWWQGCAVSEQDEVNLKARFEARIAAFKEALVVGLLGQVSQS